VTDDDYEPLTRFDYARLGWAAVSMGSGLALAVAIKINQLGPRSMWASDACPEPSQLCGQIPLGAPLSVATAMGLLWLGWRVVALVEARGGASA
jgi:hypothetical protein